MILDKQVRLTKLMYQGLFDYCFL